MRWSDLCGAEKFASKCGAVYKTSLGAMWRHSTGAIHCIMLYFVMGIAIVLYMALGVFKSQFGEHCGGVSVAWMSEWILATYYCCCDSLSWRLYHFLEDCYGISLRRSPKLQFLHCKGCLILCVRLAWDSCEDCTRPLATRNFCLPVERNVEGIGDLVYK